MVSKSSENIKFFYHSLNQNFIEKKQNLQKKLLFWNSIHKNLYNELSIIWLAANLPYKQEELISFEEFKKIALKKCTDFINQVLNEKIATFYNNASLIWKKLESDDFDRIKVAMLEIVANSISETLAEANLAQFLFDGISFLIYERKELITVEGFLNMMRIKVGIVWYDDQDYENICLNYYNFARQFILIDFPIANLKFNLLKSMKIFIGNSARYMGQHVLQIIDHKIRSVFYILETNLDAVFYATNTIYDKNNQICSYEDFELEKFNRKKKIDILVNIIDKSDEITNLFESAAFQYLISSLPFCMIKKIDVRIEFSNKIIMLMLMMNSIREKVISKEEIRKLFIFIIKNIKNSDYLLKLAFENARNLKLAKKNSYSLYQKTKSKLINAKQNLKEKATKLKEQKLPFLI